MGLACSFDWGKAPLRRFKAGPVKVAVQKN
jgi:hypothetical protein